MPFSLESVKLKTATLHPVLLAAFAKLQDLNIMIWTNKTDDPEDLQLYELKLIFDIKSKRAIPTIHILYEENFMIYELSAQTPQQDDYALLSKAIFDEIHWIAAGTHFQLESIQRNLLPKVASYYSVDEPFEAIFEIYYREFIKQYDAVFPLLWSDFERSLFHVTPETDLEGMKDDLKIRLTQAIKQEDIALQKYVKLSEKKAEDIAAISEKPDEIRDKDKTKLLSDPNFYLPLTFRRYFETENWEATLIKYFGSVSPNEMDQYKNTLVFIAARRGNTGMVKLLKDTSGVVPSDKRNWLFESVDDVLLYPKKKGKVTPALTPEFSCAKNLNIVTYEPDKLNNAYNLLVELERVLKDYQREWHLERDEKEKLNNSTSVIDRLRQLINEFTERCFNTSTRFEARGEQSVIDDRFPLSTLNELKKLHSDMSNSHERRLKGGKLLHTVNNYILSIEKDTDSYLVDASEVRQMLTTTNNDIGITREEFVKAKMEYEAERKKRETAEKERDEERNNRKAVERKSEAAEKQLKRIQRQLFQYSNNAQRLQKRESIHNDPPVTTSQVQLEDDVNTPHTNTQSSTYHIQTTLSPNDSSQFIEDQSLQSDSEETSLLWSHTRINPRHQSKSTDDHELKEMDSNKTSRKRLL